MMKLGPFELNLEKRLNLTNWETFRISAVAILFALFIFGFLFIEAGVNPMTAYSEIFSYAFANRFGIPLTINRFIFLLLCTYAFVLPFRAGLWNIGMAGQLYLGALASYGVLYLFDVNKFVVPSVAPWLIITMLLFAAMIGGALLGFIAGYLRGRYNINEIVITMMLNFIAFWLVSFMIKEGGPYMNPGGRGESFELPEALQAPLIGGIPFTILIALAVALLVSFVFNRTRLGYEIRAFGENPAAASYAGVNKYLIPMVVFIMGGAIAGLAGYHYFAAVPGVYKIARNYGFFGDLAFYGIICGLISRGNLVASILVSLLFGGLSIGGRFVQGKLHMSFGLDYALLGVLMITLVAFQFFYRYQIKWRLTPKEA